MSDTPLYDRLVDERLGRAPHEFDGYDTWDDSEEARAAFERGVAEARRAERHLKSQGVSFARHAREVIGSRSVADG
ncbi:hypothetical protein ACWDWO_27580 [Actinopolymorpha singaporensis]|uniref:Uncharacterized protein n=1 Tax=Actinopolymorpha singaporensis TaxID=117157 RepID=A0A1H1MJC6_9ACTN|nr:hypothetical protein [Actinopolymorpha singaporensis]SDR86826.1 hypothetical protein SAMN04489717_0849 [Actinopolymorpha singaporensis]